MTAETVSAGFAVDGGTGLGWGGDGFAGTGTSGSMAAWPPVVGGSAVRWSIGMIGSSAVCVDPVVPGPTGRSGVRACGRLISQAAAPAVPTNRTAAAATAQPVPVRRVPGALAAIANTGDAGNDIPQVQCSFSPGWGLSSFLRLPQAGQANV